MSIFETYKWRFIAGTIFLVFLIIMGIGVIPYASLVFEKFSLLNEQNDQIAFMSNWQDRLANLEEREAKLRSGMDTMVINLAEKDGFSKVVEELFEYADASVVSVQRIQPIEENNDQEYVSREIQLQVSGNYHSIIHFINRIEQGNYLIVINALDLRRTDEGSNLLEAAMNLEITLRDSEE